MSPSSYVIDGLPESTRERLLAAMKPSSGRVFFFEEVSKAFWIASGAVALFGALVVGSLSLSREMVSGIACAGVMLAWTLLAFGVAIRLAVQHRALPFAPGVYVIGFQLIDARRSTLKVYSLLGLQDLSATHVIRNGFYQCTWVRLGLPAGPTFKFRVHGRERAEEAVHAFETSLASLRGDAGRVAATDYLRMPFSRRPAGRTG